MKYGLVIQMQNQAPLVYSFSKIESAKKTLAEHYEKSIADIVNIGGIFLSKSYDSDNEMSASIAWRITNSNGQVVDYSTSWNIVSIIDEASYSISIRQVDKSIANGEKEIYSSIIVHGMKEDAQKVMNAEYNRLLNALKSNSDFMVTLEKCEDERCSIEWNLVDFNNLMNATYSKATWQIGTVMKEIDN